MVGVPKLIAAPLHTVTSAGAVMVGFWLSFTVTIWVAVAVLPLPFVRLKSASVPSAVLKLGYPPSGAGTTACAAGESFGLRRDCHHGNPLILASMRRRTVERVE